VNDRPDRATAIAALEAAAREINPDDVPALIGDLARITEVARRRLLVPPAPSPVAGRRLLEVPEVAARLAFKEPYVYELIRSGELRAVPYGKYVRVEEAEVDAFIDRHRSVDNGLGQWQPPRRVRRRVQTAARPPRPDPGGTRASARGDNVRRLPVGSGPAEDS
jgi:excisionase family DNA binding protein